MNFSISPLRSTIASISLNGCRLEYGQVIDDTMRRTRYTLAYTGSFQKEYVDMPTWALKAIH